MDTKYLEIIKAPIITEKAGMLNQEGKYVFSVDPRSNKTEIKLAIEKIFKVKVKEVRTVNVKPKKRRVGRHTGYTNRVKKAIVSLEDGQTIDIG